MRTKEVEAGATTNTFNLSSDNNSQVSSEASMLKCRSTRQRYMKKVEKYLPKILGSEEKCYMKLTINFVNILISKQREERRKTNLVMRN